MTIAVALLAASGFGLFLILAPESEPEFDDFMKAHEAFNMGEYELAAEIFEPRAFNGDHRSQLYMSLMEAFGLGRPVNREMAKDWAARSGARGARGFNACSIGIDWATAHFGEQDMIEAAYWVAYADNLRGASFCISELGVDLPGLLKSQIAGDVHNLSKSDK